MIDADIINKIAGNLKLLKILPYKFSLGIIKSSIIFYNSNRDTNALPTLLEY
jgi:hypothetical protein